LISIGLREPERVAKALNSVGAYSIDDLRYLDLSQAKELLKLPQVQFSKFLHHVPKIPRTSTE
jgi:hypothetical protein